MSDVNQVAAMLAAEAQCASPLPGRLEELDPQARRKVEMEARGHGLTPEAYYRTARANRRAASSLELTTDDVVAAIRGHR